MWVRPESEVAFRLCARSSTETSTGAFSNTNRLSNSGWPLGNSLCSWIVTNGRYSYSRSCILLSSKALNHWRTLQRSPSSGSFTRSAMLLINRPTVRCISGMSTGRPATVTPNSTSRSPLKRRNTKAHAAWAKVLTVS
ncbi:hypothetical protein PFLmoz3_05146 [Pseudomonas fluorescens]|uniref:Uncharacterized protein n=1 Tax=Pseudomonas fluorescens TaxID=294 RepID=A0A109LCB8_PSEFL|nr:hypothetical protein PFLmoz3_05146 [Pseudomonas fluorescens]